RFSARSRVYPFNGPITAGSAILTMTESPGGTALSRAASLLTGAVVLWLAVLPADATPAGKPDSAIPLEAYARPATLVRVATGRNLNIRCSGSGSPTVILTAGAGEQSLTWRSLQTQLAAATRVCAWDRAGFGFSDPSPAPQDIAHTSDDLEAVLAGAKLRPPYVLVGHSLGSYETLMLAFRHPGRVSGIVLIDPSAPHQNQRLRKAAPATYAAIDALQQEQTADLKACIGLMEQKPNDAGCLRPPDPGYPASLRTVLSQREHNVAAQRNLLSLLENAFTERDSQELEGAWRSLGSTPLIVLTAGEPPPVPLPPAAQAQMPQLQAEWSRMHDEIAALSSRGVNRTVPGATHYIYLERPEVVAAAVLEVLAAARENR
ncbi:MAG TPA: alpha/beta hydrolase, partial [Steroidobacteraceae bacterium]|nr:alpha/beta hydrolase [Steroidobacteraceae bacterium]